MAETKLREIVVKQYVFTCPNCLKDRFAIRNPTYKSEGKDRVYCFQCCLELTL